MTFQTAVASEAGSDGAKSVRASHVRVEACVGSLSWLAQPDHILNEMEALERAAWGSLSAAPAKLRRRMELFPEGQWLAWSEDRLVGFLNSQRIGDQIFLARISIYFANFYSYKPAPYADWWSRFTDNGTYEKSHIPGGHYLFLANLSTLPDLLELRRSSIAESLIRAALVFMSSDPSLRGAWGLARLSGLKKYMVQEGLNEQRVTEGLVEKYIETVKKGQWHDPALSLHLKMGAHTVMVVKNAMAHDDASLNWGVIIFYQRLDF